MAFVLRFTPKNFTAAKYDEVINKLEAAGAGAPKGRSYHVCFGDPDNLLVSDIWDNMEDFKEFGKTLVPLMHAIGVDPGEPVVIPVHNIVVG